MKKIMFVTLIAICMSTAQAAQKYKTIPAASNSNNSSSMTYSSRDAGFKFEARPGAGTAAKQFTFGINLEGKYGFKIGTGNLFAGLETGFFRSSSTYEGYQGVSAYGNMIPVAASGTYEFPVSKSIKLYGGTSLGVGFASGGISYDTAIYGNVEGQSASSTVFLWKFRPGMVLNDMLVAELPIGTADGNFYFIPNVGVRF